LVCVECQRRCTAVYLAAPRLACRRCLNLAYARCNASGNPLDIAEHRLSQLCSKWGVRYPPIIEGLQPPARPFSVSERRWGRFLESWYPLAFARDEAWVNDLHKTYGDILKKWGRT
jgi:hypothetical protein